MDDPRRLLERAAELRAPCEVLPRNGAWKRAQVIRVERGGVVLLLPGADKVLGGGTDVRCWLSLEGQPWTFEASVLRTAVPVPDRSQDGVLLGFIDGWRRADTEAGALVLEVLPHNGGPVSLTQGAARLVDLSPGEWTVSTPTDFGLVFVEQGAVRLRLGLPDRAPMEVGARVSTLSRGAGHLLYSLRIEQVEDGDRYREIVVGIRRVLGL
ncbi:MAG: hypothetical protein ACOZNI_03035 [Myxococcota bacterium]